jgi:hypothetical protein
MNCNDITEATANGFTKARDRIYPMFLKFLCDDLNNFFINMKRNYYLANIAFLVWMEHINLYQKNYVKMVIKIKDF